MNHLKEQDLIDITSNPVKFQSVIKRGADLCLVVKKFPQYADRLIQHVLNTPSEFERLVNGASLCDIAIAFPNYADALMTRIL